MATPRQEFIIKFDRWAVNVAANRARMRNLIEQGRDDEFLEEFHEFAGQVQGMDERVEAAVAELKEKEQA